ncbi:MAG: hypothetical protein KatS3mg022_1160 [Armatimonadota bacterium]|nr:MAG: hypothetical protein KatS3mg022_1160 [Armatimonadota bacterium]
MGISLRQVKTAIAVCGLILLANLPGLKQVAADAPLRTDTDTAAMLDAMQQTGGLYGWWHWFTGDWFLHNGFYRPTTCLSLLIDYTLYGESGWGYRLTNWLLAVLTAIGLYVLLLWFARRWLTHLLAEEWQIRLFALAGAVALSFQQTDALSMLRAISAWWWIGLCLLVTGISSRAWQSETWKSPLLRKHGWQVWLGAGAFFWGWDRLVHSGYERLIVWVPSRTALLATCLTVWSIWSLIRWGDSGRLRFLLAAGLLYAGALGAYEQPLMMVPLAVALAVATRQQWKWRAWTAFAVVVAAAAGYLALRFVLLPAALSGYQHQQLRSTPVLGILHLLQTILPVLSHTRYWATVGLNPYLFLFKDAWDTLIADLAFVGVVVAVWRSWRWFGWWLLWQGATYLPMSLLHPFEHYYYLPQLAQNAVDLALMAWGTARMVSLPPLTADSLRRYVR